MIATMLNPTLLNPIHDKASKLVLRYGQSRFETLGSILVAWVDDEVQDLQFSAKNSAFSIYSFYVKSAPTKPHTSFSGFGFTGMRTQFTKDGHVTFHNSLDHKDCQVGEIVQLLKSNARPPTRIDQVICDYSHTWLGFAVHAWYLEQACKPPDWVTEKIHLEAK